jgi:hypothetical protein
VRVIPASDDIDPASESIPALQSAPVELFYPPSVARKPMRL